MVWVTVPRRCYFDGQVWWLVWGQWDANDSHDFAHVLVLIQLKVHGLVRVLIEQLCKSLGRKKTISAFAEACQLKRQAPADFGFGSSVPQRCSLNAADLGGFISVRSEILDKLPHKLVGSFETTSELLSVLESKDGLPLAVRQLVRKVIEENVEVLDLTG